MERLWENVFLDKQIWDKGLGHSVREDGGIPMIQTLGGWPKGEEAWEM